MSVRVRVQKHMAYDTYKEKGVHHELREMSVSFTVVFSLPPF